MEETRTLYDKIGRPTLEAIVTRFYAKCFADPMIAHFFWNLDHDRLSQLQIDFVAGLLGGPRSYHGRPLTMVHADLPIRAPHFRRRQQILRESMQEFGLDGELAYAWLELEEKLQALIYTDKNPCNHH